MVSIGYYMIDISYHKLLTLSLKYNPHFKRMRVETTYQNDIKIIMFTPRPDIMCGGIMVMNYLIKCINDLGISGVRGLVYFADHRRHRNEFCNDYFNPLLMDDNTIVIYPETVKGNPLNAKNVVRWILLDLGLEVPHNHFLNWQSNDIVYHWEPSKLNYTKQLVNIWLNPHIHKMDIKFNRRDKNCYGLKKMQWIPRSLHKNMTTIHNTRDITIDNLHIPQIVKTFNQSKLFYCYDPNTFFTIMAPLCGCATVLHPIDGVSREEYFKSRILYHHPTQFCFDFGIAYGNDPMEIDRAIQSLPYAEEKFAHLRSLYTNTISDLITDMVALVRNNQIPMNTVKNIYHA